MGEKVGLFLAQLYMYLYSLPQASLFDYKYKIGYICPSVYGYYQFYFCNQTRRLGANFRGI